MSLDPERFVSGVRAIRHPKNVTIEDTEKPGFFRVLGMPVRHFESAQILMETPTYYLVSPVKMANRKNDILTVNVESGWNLLEAFARGKKMTRGQDTDTLVRPGFGVDPITMDDIDRALNVLQDMGRWDIAFRSVLDILGMSTCPASSVVWEKFPHKSKMLVMTGPTTGVYLAGCMKDVIEKWWAYCGGYHNPTGSVYVVPDAEYEDFLRGVRNPFMLAGVNIRAAQERIAGCLHPVTFLPEDLTAENLGNRPFWVHRGVVYLADVDGFVLPYWYGNMKGEAPSEVGWNREMRRALAGHMNLPLLVQRTVERTLAWSTTAS